MTPARHTEIRAYIARLDLDQLPGWTVEQRIIADLYEAQDVVRADVCEAYEALITVGKKAIVVQPMLDKPYDEDPNSSPWSRYLGPAARTAYNLGVKLRSKYREATP